MLFLSIIFFRYDLQNFTFTVYNYVIAQFYQMQFDLKKKLFQKSCLDLNLKIVPV